MDRPDRADLPSVGVMQHSSSGEEMGPDSAGRIAEKRPDLLK